MTLAMRSDLALTYECVARAVSRARLRPTLRALIRVPRGRLAALLYLLSRRRSRAVRVGAQYVKLYRACICDCEVSCLRTELSQHRGSMACSPADAARALTLCVSVVRQSERLEGPHGGGGGG